MAVAIFTKVRHDVTAAGRMHVYDYTPATTVPTGGEAVTPANFGLKSIISLNGTYKGNTVANSRQIIFEPTATGGNIRFLVAAGTEATGDLSTTTMRLTVYGDNVSGR